MTRSALALALLVSASFLAGCLSGDPPDGGAGGDGNGNGPASAPVVTEEQAIAAFENAFRSLDTPTDVTKRFSMTGSGVARNTTEPARIDFALLFDSGAGVVVMTLRTEGMGEDAGPSFGGADEEFVVGQVAKTTFFGSKSSLLASYNESEEPVTSFSDFEPTPGGGDGDEDDGGFDPSDPSSFLGAMDVDASGVQSTRGIVYKGKPAVEVKFSNTTEDGASVTATAIVFVSPDLPARIEADLRDSSAEEPLERDARMTMDFAYGTDASHALEAALVRAETMTLISSEDANQAFGGFSGGDDAAGPKTYTIQPSRDPGRVPLAEVEAVVRAGGEDESTLLTMPLEAKTASNDDVTVVFDDKDGNGKVSPGDTITLTKKSDRAREATLLLHDETTGIFIAPVPGLVLALAFGVALLTFRRR